MRQHVWSEENRQRFGMKPSFKRRNIAFDRARMVMKRKDIQKGWVVGIGKKGGNDNQIYCAAVKYNVNIVDPPEAE